MATSNPYGSGRFKINVNRVKSKKWKDADKVDYGGGWGDDDSDDDYDEPAPVSADNPRHPAWNAPPNAYSSNRSVTNPSPSRSGQRPSFDRGDERRHFASTGNFDSPYPTSQRSPFPEPQHDDLLPGQNYGMQPPLRLNTQGQGPMPGAFPTGSRGRQYPPYEDIPMSAPGAFPQQRRSGSSNRPPSDPYARHESPMRPESRSSTASHRQFPPRKQSLSQAPPPSDFTQRSHSPALSQNSGTAVAASANDDRPPPVFVRPSDIYKRMAEEMEKARKSQESSRPSTASGVREGSVGARSTVSDTKEPTSSAPPLAEDSDATRRLKPTLDPVPERKSEYGFDNMLQRESHDNNLVEEPKVESESLGVSRHGTNASSIYTDRPDPVSASSLSRNVSMSDAIPERGAPDDRPSFGLPPISRLSGFGMDAGTAENPAYAPAPEIPQSSRNNLHEGSSRAIDTGDNEEPYAKGLQHQPTFGYTSAVQQAFDQSQRQTPLAHSSTSSTVGRSNTGSTADISPIISRKPDPATVPTNVQTAYPTIPQESSRTNSRPSSSTTLKAGVHSARDDDFPPPAAFRPGYRRDVTPPSRDNSPAKKPFEVGPRAIPQAQHGSLYEKEHAVQDQVRGRAQSTKDKPLPAEPRPEATTRKVDTPSPILRSESPPKGTVRGLAGKLESSSGRSSRTNSSIQVPLPGLTQERPPQNRFDSFRPAIPGGWQSFTSSPGPGTPGTGNPGRGGFSPPRPQFTQPRTESTESIPTARAPANMEPGISAKAFAAAASAGSALAGAFTGHESAEPDQDSSRQASEEESENEWDRSTSSSDADPAPPEEHLMERSNQDSQATSVAANIPLPSATPDHPHSLAASTPLSMAASSEADVPQSTLDYFPAPLRTSRSIDPSSVRPPIPNVTVLTDTPNDSENERLQNEIVKSLTPKSSNLEDDTPAQGPLSESISGYSAHQAVTDAHPGPSGSHQVESFTSGPVGAGHGPLSSHQPVTREPAVPATASPPLPRSVTPQPTETSLPRDGAGLLDETQNTPRPSNPLTTPSQQRGVVPGIDAALTASRQPQPFDGRDSSTAAKPFLQQRFSWETGSSPPASVTTPKATSPPSTSSPDTIRVPSLPAAFSSDATQIADDTAQPVARQESEPPQQSAQPAENSTFMHAQHSNQFTPASKVGTANVQTSQPGAIQSGEPPAFRTILNLGSPAERIKAFEESRQFYAAADDQLQGWLMSMKTSENAELFATNGRLSLDNSDRATSHKPSPRRMLTESTGARHMQEDSKKLMLAAGRFGGKAGSAAKGFFAKGKEKMRNASSGEKGILAGRRKSSTGHPPDDAEDVSLHSKSRDSTYLEGPPQIPFNITPASPLSSPTDWFPNRELSGSQTSGLDSILQQGATTTSTAPANQIASQPALERERDTPRGSVAPATADATVAAVASSPAISALDSEQEQVDDDVVPSRSISQLTKPTDRSPVESPHTAIVERSASQRGGSAAPPTTAAEGPKAAASTLAPPPPITDRHDGSTSDAESSDRSLQVPQARRRSVVSDVSSASPSPAADSEGQQLRRSVSLSPADEEPVAAFPGLREEPGSQSKEPLPPTINPKDAQQPVTRASEHHVEPPNTGVASPITSTEPVRPHDSKPAVDTAEPRRAPEQVIQPLASQSEPAAQPYDSGEHRPFSFAGIEGVGALHQSRPLQEHDLNRFPSQPMSPVSQTRSSAALSKELSQVSAEEVTDQPNATGQRHSRSYSRPFGVDPNVKIHPALRASEPDPLPIDRAQMYSSESPLPSARRTQEDLERQRQYHQQEQQPAMPRQPQPQPQPNQQGYRIPGPYVQEYRSPKQISSPKSGRSQAQVQASGKPLPSAIRSQSSTGQASPQPQPGRNSYIASERANSPSYQDQQPYISPEAYAEYDMKPGDYQVYSQSRPVQQQRQSMGPPPPPVQQQFTRQQTPVHAGPAPSPTPPPHAERKKSAFGKLFGGASKSSKLQKQGRPESPVDPPPNLQKEKRTSFLRRTDSVSSKQSSKHGGQDQLGQLPPPNMQTHSARRQSRDVLRAPTPDNDKPAEGRKKRFSGFGGKLFKSSSNARAATAPTQTTGSDLQRTGQRVTSPGPYSAQDPRVTSPDPYSARTPYEQYPAGPGSYFNQGQVQSPHPQSAYPQGQPQQQYPPASSPYQQQQRPGSYGYPPQSPQPQDQQHARGLYSSGVYANPNQNRPSDLRIDTSSQNRSQYNAPATAPAQIQPHLPKTSSFTSAPHNPNPSPGIPATTRPMSPASRATQAPSDPRSHVIDLHKRSRSPKLGRTTSEDFDAQRRQQPNSTLGTFTSKNISPVGGVRRPENDQERPFAITVPGLDDEASERRKKQSRRERVAAGTARSDTPVSVESGGHSQSTHPTASSTTGGLDRNVSVLEGYNSTPMSPRQARRESARDRSTPGMIAELPGSKASGYESEEEIPMSATAYPGQEWMPVFVGDGRWDD
ncbi:hypothetical protein H2200_007065 [Cladophialophora chaetospira]|uniref:SWI-SNF chromatin-remodeling complex protein n=1 Tax=Cladophialophora chaetospira TaxID=386627 RepID=A0AA38X742_9EURO|nr:hypothetical protein H2200_007065 [Cladophialophora chaetospira]